MTELKDLKAEMKAAPAVAETVKREPKKDKFGRAYATGRRKDASARVWLKMGSGKMTVNGIDIEGQVTASIDSILNGQNNYVIYCLGGHSESALPERITSTLKKRGFQFKTLTLFDGDIPEDCDILVINSPESDLNKNEIEAIKNYVCRGGNVFMTAAADFICSLKVGFTYSFSASSSTVPS